MDYFSIVNFEKFQHYKNRNPPWIKLHTSILHSHNFFYLDEKSKLHLILLWVLASRHDNKLPQDQTWLQHEMGIKSKINLKILKDQGFIECSSNTLAICLQDASNLHQNPSPEREGETYKEETETEKALSGNPDCLEILNYLNEKTGKHFKPVIVNLELIRSRLKEGRTIEDLKRIVDLKTAEWIGTDQEKYLRPETLFNRTKCAQYEGETKASMPTVSHGKTEPNIIGIDKLKEWEKEFENEGR